VIRSLLATVGTEDREPQLAAVYGSLAGLLHGSGRFEEQLETTHQALDLASTGHNEALLLDAQAAHGLALINVGRLDEGLRLLEDVIPIAESRDDLGMLHFAISSVAWVYQARGEFERSGQLLQRLLGVAEREMNVTRTVYALNSLGRNAYFVGNWMEAQGYIERAYALCRDAGQSWVAPYPRFELGRLFLARGDWNNATRYLKECIIVAEEIGDLPALRSGERLLAELDLLHRDSKSALSRLTPLFEAMGTSEVDAGYLIPTLAEAYVDAQDYARAQHLLTSFLQADLDHYPRMGLMEALRVQGLLLSRQNRWEEAQNAFEHALTIVPTYPYGRARVLYDYAGSHIRAADTNGAYALLAEALTLFRRLGARHWCQCATEVLQTLSPALVPAED
jgi:tetratricopeptide (TPR) repeat protein